MNKLYISAIFTFCLCISSLVAQNVNKVKGNKNVTTITTEIKPFHTIIVDEDFDIEIIYNNVPSVIIETDENLHEFINFDVIDGVLTFDKTTKITSKKRMNIQVNFNEELTNIKTADNGEITSFTPIDLQNCLLISEGSSKVGLEIKTNDFQLQSNGRSKIKLNLTAETTKLTLSDNSKYAKLTTSQKTFTPALWAWLIVSSGEPKEVMM